MTRSTIFAGSLALSAIVTVALVHRTDAQDGPRPIPANLASYLVPFRALYDLEKSFPRWPLPAGERAYGSFDGARIKQDVDAITAISRRSRESGAQYWGRIAGSPYDAATRKWIGDRFRQLGASDVKEQSFPLPPQWHPVKWTVSSSADHGPAHVFNSAFPFTNSPGTPSGGVELDVAYVGLGRAADFAGRIHFFFVVNAEREVIEAVSTSFAHHGRAQYNRIAVTHQHRRAGPEANAADF